MAKNPTYTTEEPAPWPELGRKDPNPCAVPELVAELSFDRRRSSHRSEPEACRAFPVSGNHA